MISIAIDGPAGAGKSTIAKEVSKKLGYIYVDTGALYRSIAYYFLNNKISLDNIDIINKELRNINLKIIFQDEVQQVILNDQNITEKIRTNEISMAASKISAIPEIRKFLLSLQRDFAKQNNVIMDGRDIGTVVLPNAEIKIFLTATAEERAKRRYKELISKNIPCSMENVLKDIIERDNNDMNRDIAPLKEAPDSIKIDTTTLSLEEVIFKIYNIAKNFENKIRQV